jgi:hypothetical protein
MSRVLTLASTAVMAALLVLPAPAPGQWTLVVHGDGRALGPTPITVPVDPQVRSGPHTLIGPDGAKLAAYGYERDQQLHLVTVLPSVPETGTVVYQLSQGAAEPGGAELAPRDRSPNIEIQLNGQPFTTLVLATGPKPFLFPVIGPTGDRFTRSYPMEEVPGEDQDHPHQRSFWFTHGKVNGVDFWSELPGHGRILPKRVQSAGVQNGSAAVIVRSEDDWIDAHAKPVCSDERTMTFYGTHSPRIIDFDITIKATHGPVTFGDTKEGTFGLRVASSMDVKRQQGGKITNAEGITDAAAWGKASPWVDYTGPIGGKTVGIAILNHPSSFRYPTTWHVRDYGLFAANPFGYHDFGQAKPGDHTIPEGGTITFRYRVILHEGDTESARIAEAFSAYAKPPRVEVVRR